MPISELFDVVTWREAGDASSERWCGREVVAFLPRPLAIRKLNPPPATPTKPPPSSSPPKTEVQSKTASATSAVF